MFVSGNVRAYQEAVRVRERQVHFHKKMRLASIKCVQRGAVMRALPTSTSSAR
jgi:hypothetical protein